MRNFDRVAGIYDSTRKLPDPVMSTVVEALATELQDRGAILDAGVGTGRFAGPLRDKGLDVVGLDVSQAMLSEAKRKSLQDLVRGELTTMPFTDKAFDSCLMIHILHLVEDPASLLSEVARVCRTKVVSLAETSDTVSVREDYIRLSSEAGYGWGGISETKLTSLVSPAKLTDIVSYSVETDIGGEIEYFRNRLSAVTWDLPEKIHEGIIAKLESTLSPGISKCNRTIKLAAWEVDSIQSAIPSLVGRD
ncbi:MAG TPA: class I SAM-dependent methyltransferase [Nitrososphaerales archaeon]|nr:class I SAM-dependent methyltransferase [Nitrososphaerales archaeon]